MNWKGLDSAGHVRWATLPSEAIATFPVGGVAGVREAEGLELSVLQNVRAKWGALIDKHSASSGVPASWIAGIMCAESEGNAAAVSPAGALGLMQIMPFWAKGRNLRDPEVNLAIATAEILAPMRKRGLDLVECASCYNAGPDSKTGGPKRNDVFLYGVKEEVPANLRGSTPWGSYYISRIIRCNNSAVITTKPASSGGAGGLFLIGLALLLFAREVL